MKIVHVNSHDLEGGRFNGYDLIEKLRKLGHEVFQCVWDRGSQSPYVWSLVKAVRFRQLNSLIKRFEIYCSVHSLFYPYMAIFPFYKRARQADIVHYHLIHNYFFSLFLWPFLSRFKPTVWTLHDPWALTGRCVYPMQCDGWKHGCGRCPSLETHFPMHRDRSGLMWKIKKWVYRCSRFELIVASRWMENLVKQSPLLQHCRVHLVPFGIDLELFRQRDTEEAKKRLGVFPGSKVVGFRMAGGAYKGVEHILAALREVKLEEPLCLLTFNGRGMVDEFRGRFQIIDMGWIDDQETIAQAYAAVDVFMMPSNAEAFGMMAIEAMACGKAVIVSEGTSLPEIAEVSEGAGVAVPLGNSRLMADTLVALLKDEERRRVMGEKARKVAERKYDENLYFQRLLHVYQGCVDRVHGIEHSGAMSVSKSSEA